VGFDESLRDVEAETGSSTGRARTVALEGDIEDTRKVFGRHAATRVAHGDVGIVRQLLVDTGLDDDRPVARSVANRVLEQVPERVQHLGRRHVELRWRPDEPALEPNPFRGRDRGGTREDVGDEIAKRYPLEVKAERAGLGATELEEIVDELGEMVDLLAHRA